MPEPSNEEIVALLASIIVAVDLCLRRKGLLDEDAGAEIAEDLLSIEAASRASVPQRIAFGERHGLRVRRLGFMREGDAVEFKGPHCVALSGFSLHYQQSDSLATAGLR